MSEDQSRNVRVAMSLVVGVVAGSSDADDLVLEAFDDLGQAASAYAYLAGFLLQTLAQQRHQDPAATAIWVQSLLSRS